MNIKKNGVLKRALVFVLIFTLTIVGSSLAVSATEIEMDDESIIVYDANGNIISYESVFEQLDTLSTIADDGIVVNEAGDHSFKEASISTYSSLTAVSNTADSPYRNVCKVRGTFPDGTPTNSSGILVGPNIALVSGHGVYDKDHGGAAKNISVAAGEYIDPDLGYQYPDNQGSTGIINMRLVKGWADSKLNAYDWAVLTLNKSYNTFQSYGYFKDYTAVNGREITVIGYPGANMYYSTGKITGTTNSMFNSSLHGLWTTSATSEERMSGGPVIDKSTGLAVGIINGEKTLIGTNVCVPLNELIFNTINEAKK